MQKRGLNMRFPGAVFCTVLIVLSTSAEEFILSPLQDAYTCDCAPGTTNPNGGPNYLYQGPVYNCQVNLYMEWDLSGLGTGMVIDSAELWLYCKSITGTVSGGSMVYYLITESWDETTVTYNTMPSWSTGISSLSPWPTVNAWISVDVTEFVEAWYEGTEQNFGLFGHYLNASGSCCAGFYSSNYANEDLRPYLSVSTNEVTLDPDSWGEIKTTNPE
jgi:hypothetical protein